MARKGDLLGVRHRWFRPLWRRIALTAACFGWAGVEAFAFASPGWFWVFAGLGLYCIWHFFVAFDPEDFGGGDGAG